ncbi:unnamed protein product [Closterium sp. NIES-54]
MMEKNFSFMSFYEQHQQAAPAQSNNSDNNDRVTPMSLGGSSYVRGNQQQPTFALYEPQRVSFSFMPHQQSSPGQEKTLDALQSEGLVFESQRVHFGHPSAGGCQRSTGDPRLILGKGYRLVVLGGYGRTDPLLNKPFYPITKHIALRYFLALELQQRSQLRLTYMASQTNTADVFTKALQPCDHQRFCTVIVTIGLNVPKTKDRVHRRISAERLQTLIAFCSQLQMT